MRRLSFTHKAIFILISPFVLIGVMKLLIDAYTMLHNRIENPNIALVTLLTLSYAVLHGTILLLIWAYKKYIRFTQRQKNVVHFSVYGIVVFSLLFLIGQHFYSTIQDRMSRQICAQWKSGSGNSDYTIYAKDQAGCDKMAAEIERIKSKTK